MKDLKQLQEKYAKLGKEIEALKNETEYPIYCRSLITSCVVRFTGNKTGEVVVEGGNDLAGDLSSHWVSHKDLKYWEKLKLCPDTGFFDGQLVWCWDDDETHMRVLKFYDSKNKCTFDYGGETHSDTFDNYKAYEGDYPEWALEAFKTLQR